MYKRKMILAAVLLAAVLLAGCERGPAVRSEEQAEEKTSEIQEENTMKITIGQRQFTASLENNEAAAQLREHLPLTLDMSELNGNEKYNYLDFRLPTDSACPGTIQTGDIMLYGDSCIVVFYKSFSTSYSYTKLGHITDASELESVVGAGSVEMTFEN